MSCTNDFTAIRASRFKLVGFLFVLIISFPVAQKSVAASSIDPHLHIDYENNSLTLTAQNVDLKKVLSALSKKADIDIRYPSSLKKKITLDKRGVSLKEALRSLLKGVNHAIIYSGSAYKPFISKVLIYKNAQKNALQARKEKRLTSRINSYERRIESLRNNLAKAGRNSRRGKRHLKQIQKIEKKIEKLERQLN
jgi:hypothetical protein